MQRDRRLLRRASLVMAGFVIFGASLVPVAPAHAIEKDLLLGDNLDQFAQGSFQRTALANIDADGAGGANDLLGGVQLTPVGVIRDWRGTDTSRNLPTARTEHAAVYVSGRIYVMGGLFNTGTDDVLTDSVVSAAVELNVIGNQDNRGQLIVPEGTNTIAWRNEAPLPTPTPDENPSTTETAPRAQIAAAALPRSGGGGFIYAIGGAYDAGVDRLSISEVSIATVAANGTLTWRNGPQLKENNLTQPIQSSTAVINQALNGKTYLYVLGGLQRVLNGGITDELGSRAVYRAEIDTSSGNLSAWERQTSDIPIADDPDFAEFVGTDDIDRFGIWNGDGFAQRVFAVDGLSSQDVVYLVGGQVAAGLTTVSPAARYTSKAYQGVIDANGTLTWTPPGTYVATLSDDWFGHTVAVYNGNIQVIGGIGVINNTPAAPVRTAQASYLQEDGKLARIGDSADFARSNDVLRQARFNHATVVVPAGPTRAFVYVLGGTGENQATSDIFYGVIGENDNSVVYAPNGYYYSQVVDIVRAAGVNSADGQLRTIDWGTTITRTATMDVQIEYRYTTAASMPQNTPWLVLREPTAGGAGSVNGPAGQNSAPLKGYDGGDNPPARLVQFRARLVSEGGTPVLRKVAIRVAFPGAPNLKFPENPIDKVVTIQGGKPTIDNIAVRVVNRDSAEAPTRDASFDRGGIFWVDLFISPPAGATAPTFGQTGQAYACVAKASMPANSEVLITEWYNPSDGGQCKTRISPTELLLTPGTYTIHAYVDSMDNVSVNPVGLVAEGTVGSANEGDNATSAPLTVQIAAPDAPVQPGCETLPLPANCPVAPDPDPTPAQNTGIKFPLILR